MTSSESKLCPKCGAKHPVMAVWDETILAWVCRACANVTYEPADDRDLHACDIPTGGGRYQ